jgi:prophage antirepressor-like protein
LKKLYKNFDILKKLYTFASSNKILYKNLYKLTCKGIKNIVIMIKLRSSVINKLREMRGVNKKLAIAMNVSHQVVYHHLKRGDPGRYFIKIDALRCIQEILGINNIEQLLETEGTSSFEDICTDTKIEMIQPKHNWKTELANEPSPGIKNEILKVEEIPQASSGQHLFTFAPSNQTIRVETINMEPWFCGKDVCKVLDISNHNDALSRLDDDERNGVGITDLIGRTQVATFVNESGLYNLIFQSRKPEARVFRKWVTSDVLPTLRRTGEYRIKKRCHNTPVPADSNIAQLLQLITGYLQKGDRKIIAKQLDVNPVSVTDVLSGKTKSSTILQALCGKALENKQNGFVNAYSHEFVTTAITKLT